MGFLGSTAESVFSSVSESLQLASFSSLIAPDWIRARRPSRCLGFASIVRMNLPWREPKSLLRHFAKCNNWSLVRPVPRRWTSVSRGKRAISVAWALRLGGGLFVVFFCFIDLDDGAAAWGFDFDLSLGFIFLAAAHHETGKGQAYHEGD